MLDSFMRHVTKDSFGPVSMEGHEGAPLILHKFHDSFSILNWGRMPDLLQGRGRLASRFFSVLNDRYRDPESWKTFLRSPEALTFRKAGGSLSQGGGASSVLNALADTLPLRSNYLGSVRETVFRELDPSRPLARTDLIPPEAEGQESGLPLCEHFPEIKGGQSLILGRAVCDFRNWRSATGAKLLPFEIENHFVLNPVSLETLKTDSLSIPKTASLRMLQDGASFDFPLVELVSNQDPCERRIGFPEALGITGFSPERLQETLLLSAWIAAWCRYQLRGFRLHSIRLRFGLDAGDGLVLVDAFGPDDLVLEREGKWIHPQALISYYAKTSWFEGVVRARRHAIEFGLTDWKRLCVEPAPVLDPAVKSTFESEYRCLGGFGGRST